MATISTPVTARGLSLDVRGFSPADVLPEALIVTTSSLAATIEGDEPAVRVPFIDMDDDAAFVPEGEDIDEADPDHSEVVVHTGKVAVLAKISREQYFQGDAANLLSTSVRRAILRKANSAFLSQPAPSAPATTPPAGLLNQGVTDGGAISANLDALSDALMTIEEADGVSTNIISSPSAWASLSKLKTTSDSNMTLVGSGTDVAPRQLLSVPAAVANAMPPNELLLVDKAAVLSAYGQVQLAFSDQVYFGSDSIGLRCTYRFGQALVDPARVVKVTVTPPE